MNMKKKLLAATAFEMAVGVIFVLLYQFIKCSVRSIEAFFNQQKTDFHFKDLLDGIWKDRFLLIIFLAGFLTGILIVVIRIVSKKMRGFYDAERNLTYSKKGTFGTATFMTDEEFNKWLQVTDLADTNEIIFGILEK